MSHTDVFSENMFSSLNQLEANFVYTNIHTWKLCDIECLNCKLPNHIQKNSKISEMSHTDASEGRIFWSVFVCVFCFFLTYLTVI